MFRIRPKQWDTFREQALRDFEDTTLERLRRFSPRHFHVLSDDEARAVIRHGLRRAGRHGFTLSRSVRRYIDMMFLLGSSFDEDPLLPWARDALRGASEQSQAATIDRLYELAWEHVRVIRPELTGESTGGSAPFIEELRGLRREPNEPLDPTAVAPLKQHAFERLSRLFPRKIERAGQEGARAAIDGACALAERRGLATTRGTLMLLAMAFVLGSGCTEDPLLPWLAPILDDPAIKDPAERVNCVYSNTVDALRRWWS